MKKFIKILLPLTMVLFLSACNTVIADNTPDHSGQTLTGVITSIDGTQVSLTLGKLKENDKSSQMMQDNMPAFENGEMPQLPEGEMPSFENGELPEMSDGEMPQFEQGQMPEMNNGQMPQSPHGMMPGGPGMPTQGTSEEGQMPSWNEGEAPELPEGETQMTPGQMPPFENGEMPEKPSFENGEMPELPEGELPEMTEGEMPSFGNGQMRTSKGGQMQLTYTFKESEKTDTIDLKDCVVTLSDGTSGTFEDLKVGDVIRVIVSKENIVESVRVYQIENQEE